MAPEVIDPVLEEFASLPARERRAIERHLSGAERTLLRDLVKRREVRAPAAPTPTKPDLSGYSPWLSKRLIRLLDARESTPPGVTARTLEALRVLIAGASPVERRS